MNSLLEYGMFIIMLMRLQINCDNDFLQMMKQWEKKNGLSKTHSCKQVPNAHMKGGSGSLDVKVTNDGMMKIQHEFKSL